MDVTGDENAVIKKPGVRSFGIDDILGHTQSQAKKTRQEERQRGGHVNVGRSPLDALFTMTTNFESMKQKSGKSLICKSSCKMSLCSYYTYNRVLWGHPVDEIC